MEKLSELEDPRQPSNGTRHDFREILVIAVCAMLSDADSFEDIEAVRDGVPALGGRDRWRARRRRQDTAPFGRR